MRFFIVFLVIFAGARITTLRLYYFDVFRPTYNPSDWASGYTMLWKAHSESLYSGLMADSVIALGLALILAFPVVRPVLRFLAIVLFCAFMAANYEHVKYNFSNINLSMSENAFSMTFILGQLTPSLIKIFGMLSVAALAVWMVLRVQLALSVLGPLALVVCGVLVFLPRELHFSDPLWMQAHPLVPAKSIAVSGVDTRSFEDLLPVPSDALRAAASEQNILVIYMESVSLKSLELADMEALQALREQNISFERYIGNQIITANGLYTTLTGDYPFLDRKELKWYDLDPQGARASNSVPAVLKEAGYRTAFLQSAPLAYMSKDKVMGNLGFSEVYGAESWTESYSENEWGIDDLALFEGVLDFIDRTDADQPWFVSVLTTGTHAPYNIPQDFAPAVPSDRTRALSYLDMSIGVLMAELEKRGVLENTIVVLTSDESRERSFENPLADNILLHWLPLIIVHPSLTRAALDGFIGSERFPEILAAVLGVPDTAKLQGLARSKDRVVFANPYTQRVFVFDQATQELIICVTPAFNCALFQDVHDVVEMGARTPHAFLHFPDLKRVVAAIDGQ